jgi:hypothetical protein
MLIRASVPDIGVEPSFLLAISRRMGGSTPWAVLIVLHNAKMLHCLPQDINAAQKMKP